MTRYNDILKYSEAGKITIQITRDASEITLTIEDDGLGFERTVLTYSEGNGWKNIQSRANLINGMLEIDTTPGQRDNVLILNAPSILVKKGIRVSTD